VAKFFVDVVFKNTDLEAQLKRNGLFHQLAAHRRLLTNAGRGALT
jgi:hypothetical protein